MRKTVFRPFWSYDVQKTERWLSEMAGQGWRLQAVNPALRAFRFEQSEPQKLGYRILSLFVKKNQYLPLLVHQGWGIAFSNRNWCFLFSANPTKDAVAYPLREDINRRNCTIYEAAMTLMVLSWCALPFYMFLVGFSGSEIDLPLEFDFSLPEVAIAMISAVTFAWSVFSVVKLAPTIQWPATEQNLPHTGEMCTYYKSFWVFAPDKLCEWLEYWEAKGWNLSRADVSKFYFVRGNARKVKYCSEYRKRVDQGYISNYQNNGWCFVTNQKINMRNSCVVWAKEYQDGEPIPTLSGDRSVQIKLAGKIAMIYGQCGVIFLVSFVLNLFVAFSQATTRSVSYYLNAVFLVLTMEFGMFFVRSLRYYLRLRRKAKLNI
jgi:hypothetical protein